MTNWITDSLPEPQDINDECNEYYLVRVENYSSELAMYLVNEDGETGWYTSYISKIIKPVTGWHKLPLIP